jgi:hypothetical protein
MYMMFLHTLPQSPQVPFSALLARPNMDQRLSQAHLPQVSVRLSPLAIAIKLSAQTGKSQTF